VAACCALLRGAGMSRRGYTVAMIDFLLFAVLGLMRGIRRGLWYMSRRIWRRLRKRLKEEDKDADEGLR